MLTKVFGKLDNFPWISALSLGLPLAHMLTYGIMHPGSPRLVAGHGFVALGYLLLMVSITTGKFPVFKLKKGIDVLIAALSAWGFGMLLMYVH